MTIGQLLRPPRAQGRSVRAAAIAGRRMKTSGSTIAASETRMTRMRRPLLASEAAMNVVIAITVATGITAMRSVIGITTATATVIVIVIVIDTETEKQLTARREVGEVTATMTKTCDEAAADGKTRAPTTNDVFRPATAMTHIDRDDAESKRFTDHAYTLSETPRKRCRGTERKRGGERGLRRVFRDLHCLCSPRRILILSPQPLSRESETQKQEKGISSSCTVLIDERRFDVERKILFLFLGRD